MKGRPPGAGAVNGRGAGVAEVAARANAAAQALRSSLQRIGALHGELAAAYHDLARDLDTSLDVLGEASLYASMPAQEPQPEFLTESDVAELLQISARTVRRRVSEGKLPAPIRVSPGRVRWRRQDLDQRLGQGAAS